MSEKANRDVLTYTTKKGLLYVRSENMYCAQELSVFLVSPCVFREPPRTVAIQAGATVDTDGVCLNKPEGGRGSGRKSGRERDRGRKGTHAGKKIG